MSIEKNYMPRVWEQVTRLHSWASEYGIYVVIANQGFSVKVFNKGTNENMKLEDLVSLYNKGRLSYAYYTKLTDWQACQLQRDPIAQPITLQRAAGILITDHHQVQDADSISYLLDIFFRRNKELRKNDISTD